MKKVNIYRKDGSIRSENNLYEDPTEWINNCITNNSWGLPERWVQAKELIENDNPNEPEHWMWHSEYYEDSDILQTEERTDPITNESTTWVLLRADYTIEIEDITDQVNKQNRITELKKLLADSDFRMTTDYYKRMNPQDQTYWEESRESWRTELRTLGE